MNAIKLIVFDWDGTLVDSEHRIVTAMQDAIRDAGLPPLPTDTLKNVIGLGLGIAIETLLPDCDRAVHQAVADAYRHHFLAADKHAVSFPDAGPVLKTLADRDYFLGVATGKSRHGLDRDLDETGFKTYFHATRCADETHSKPHPQMLFDVMERVGVEAHETLMIGDTEYDLQMARNAGAASVGVAYGVHEPDRLHRHDPLIILDRLGDLIPFLDRSGHS
ncbi:MAG: HAD-IA family hydrolase [Gammaproteobacteria bacterium]|nr:HAD-IA family hydrolase [Gammaproteobacteria bacterium]MCP5136079.1 HAD-IA family hydrolase [Gammaproteobacteria bacterium]